MAVSGEASVAVESAAIAVAARQAALSMPKKAVLVYRKWHTNERQGTAPSHDPDSKITACKSMRGWKIKKQRETTKRSSTNPEIAASW
jgi:hypothetical protein